MEQFTFLSHYRVLDLCDGMGALCGKLLRDLGMQVIKLESPDGDPLRREPPFASGHAHLEGSLPFAYLNAGKQGITLDLTRPEGRSLFLDLVQRSDIVVDSHEPGYMESLGIGYDRLLERQPKLVLVPISGFGQSGPYRNYLAPDIVTTAMGGLLYISGDPALPPCMPPETQSYYYGSLHAAYGAMLALWQRETKEIGAYVDTSIQASLALHEHVAVVFVAEGRRLKRAGSQHQHTAPANLFPCTDGYISLFVNQRHWPLFLEAWEGHPKELEEPKWKLNKERRAHADWINSCVAAFTSRHGKEDLAHLLQKRGIPALPVNTPADFLNDAHIQDRGFFTSVSHPVLGSYEQPGAPFIVDGHRSPQAPAPLLGQHNVAIYGELGLGAQALGILAAEKVI